LIDASIPLWNLTLAPVVQDLDFEQRIDYDMQPRYEDVSETESPQQADEDDNDFMERRSEWVEENG